MDETGEEVTSAVIPSWLFMTLYAVTCFLVITGNALVLSHVMISKKRNASTLFVGSIALADLVIGLFVIPSSINSALAVEAGTPVDVFTCRLQPYFQLLSVSASVLSLLAVAVDRHRAVVLVQKKSITEKQAVLGIIALWGFSAVYSTRIFLQQWVESRGKSDGESQQSQPYQDHANSTEVMYPDDLQDSGVQVDEYFCDLFHEETIEDLFFRVADFVLLYIIPLVVLAVLYAAVIRKLWFKTATGSGSAETTKKKRRLVKMFLLIVILFFLCWGPWHLIDIIDDMLEVLERRANSVGEMNGEEADEEEEEEELASNTARMLCGLLALSNSWFSPLVYFVYNENFKKHVFLVLTCRIRCRAEKVTPGTDVSQSYATNAIPQNISQSNPRNMDHPSFSQSQVTKVGHQSNVSQSFEPDGSKQPRPNT